MSLYDRNHATRYKKIRVLAYVRTAQDLAQPLAALFLTTFFFLGHYMLGRERQGVGKRGNAGRAEKVYRTLLCTLLCCGRVRRLWRARLINSHTQEHNNGSNDVFGTQRNFRDWSSQQIASVNRFKSNDLRFAFRGDVNFKSNFKISVELDGITSFSVITTDGYAMFKFRYALKPYYRLFISIGLSKDLDLPLLA